MKYITEDVPFANSYQFKFEGGTIFETVAVDIRSATIHLAQWLEISKVSMNSFLAVIERKFQMPSIMVH